LLQLFTQAIGYFDGDLHSSAIRWLGVIFIVAILLRSISIKSC
jgi:hypothetical protein